MIIGRTVFFVFQIQRKEICFVLNSECLKIGGRLCLFLSKPIWHLLFSISFTENVEIVASFNEV